MSTTVRGETSPTSKRSPSRSTRQSWSSNQAQSVKSLALVTPGPVSEAKNAHLPGIVERNLGKRLQVRVTNTVRQSGRQISFPRDDLQLAGRPQPQPGVVVRGHSRSQHHGGEPGLALVIELKIVEDKRMHAAKVCAISAGRFTAG
ncbi:MAG: hypothetical protein WD894_22345 [Pirellulales bacterium]